MKNRRPKAVVTGCSSGIGQAITDRLLDGGWQIEGLCRSRPLTRENLVWHPVDLSRPEEIRGACAGINRVEAVVHAAGFQKTNPLGSLVDSDFREMWSVHVEAPAILLDSLIPRVSDGGRIILIGSRTMSGAAAKSQYAATKSALVGMARSWAIELLDRRITVNVIAPGPTQTPMLHDPGRAGVPPRTPPLGKFVDREDLAALTTFLVGPHGKSLTGQVLTVCGGASL